MGEHGFSLMELVVVVIILGILSLVAIRNVSESDTYAKFQATIQEMENLEHAMVGNPSLIANGIRTDFGYVGDMGQFPTTLDQLVTDQGGNWNGPYITIDFQDDPNNYLNDAWGDAYQWTPGTLTIYSEGDGEPITKVIGGGLPADYTANAVYGQIYGQSSWTDTVMTHLTVSIQLQSGGTINGTILSGPSYSVTGVHIGNHTVLVNYFTGYEIKQKGVCVLPNSNTPVNFNIAGF